jgi:hypothetical protein
MQWDLYRSLRHVSFLEQDFKTPLSLKLRFKEPEKIRDLARTGEAMGTSEDRMMIEQGIEKGRGAVFLRFDTGPV